jgi:hypothetical protein
MALNVFYRQCLPSCYHAPAARSIQLISTVRIVRATDRWLPPKKQGRFALSFRGLLAVVEQGEG